MRPTHLPDSTEYSSSVNSMEVTTDSPIPDRWLFQINGLVQFSIEEKGRHNHESRRESGESHFSTNEIPGVSVSSGLTHSSVFIDRPGKFTFLFTIPVTNAVRISLQLFTSSRRMHAFFFRTPLLSKTSRFKLTYDTANYTNIPFLELDQEGNGRTEKLLPEVLDAEAACDTTPPTTSLQLRDGKAVATAKDNDNGSGLLRTYYTTDIVTRHIYSEPFLIPLDAKIVMAFSEDRAGNLEYPGAALPVLGISKSEVELTIEKEKKEMSGVLEATNLDPLLVSRQLPCEIETDATWLTIEPKSGITPISFKLSAHISELADGENKAKVILRSTAPGTVFAEKIIQVRALKTDNFEQTTSTKL